MNKMVWLLLLTTVLLHHNRICAANALALMPDVINRRVFIAKVDILLATTVYPSNSSNIQSSNSSNGARPARAPLKALLPASRLKIWVDEIFSISQDISTTKDPSERYTLLQRVNEKLSNPPMLFKGEKIDKRTSSTTAQLTTGVSTANKEQYQSNRKGLNFGEQISAMANQADVERQWGMLQYAEAKREEGNEMRRAFNFYTRQLTFADEFVLTASKDERKKMIRNDELPTLTAVISSDLDRRDLYRNDFLTAIDDACAESGYQVKQNAQDVDVTDLVDLIRQAYTALDSWFSLIGQHDVDEAIQEIQLSG